MNDTQESLPKLREPQMRLSVAVNNRRAPRAQLLTAEEAPSE